MQTSIVIYITCNFFNLQQTLKKGGKQTNKAVLIIENSHTLVVSAPKYQKFDLVNKALPADMSWLLFSNPNSSCYSYPRAHSLDVDTGSFCICLV